jgi:MFS family permease
MKNKALLILFISNGIFIFAASLFGPLFAVFVETIDTNVISISLSWSAFLLSTTFFMLIIRKFGEKVKEKEYLLILGYIIRAIVWFIFPTISSIFTLIVLQILLGLGESLGTPAYDTLFAEHLDKNNHLRNYTDWKLISNILSAIAIIIGGIFVNAFGFTLLFYAMSTLALISAIIIWNQPRKLL